MVRGSIEDGEFSLWYLKDGRVAAARSGGRADDLEHARRLMAAGTAIAGREGELGDVGSDLGGL